jgi:hypothetical protein
VQQTWGNWQQEGQEEQLLLEGRLEAQQAGLAW